jgi:hypothetical protein
VATQRFRGLEYFKLRDAFLMSDHVMANSGECADLFKF